MNILLALSIVVSSFLLTQQPPAKPDANAAERTRYVGLTYTNLPKGLEQGAAFSFGEIDDPHMFGIQEVTRGRASMMWLEQMVGRDKDGKGSWKVKDVMILPAMNNRMFLSNNCTVNRKDDRQVVTVASERGNSDYLRLFAAYRVNLRSEKIEKLPLTGVRCISEGIGGP